MSNVITDRLDNIVVKETNRATILDGALFQYYVSFPLTQRDSILAKYIDTLSADAYFNDLVNNIYRYTTSGGDKDYNIHIYSTNVFSARDITATNVSAQKLTATNTTANNVSAVNYTATTVSATSLSAIDNFNVNMTALGQGFTSNMKFVDVVDKIDDRGDDVNEIISSSEDIWSSISAIDIINGNVTRTLTPNVLKFSKTDNITFSYSNKCLTVGVSELHNNATVENGVLIFTNEI